MVSVNLFKETEEQKSLSNNSSRRSSGNLSLPSPIPVDDGCLKMRIPGPDIPMLGDYFDVHVAFAANPFNFTCQPFRNLEQLRDMMDDMQNYYNTNVSVWIFSDP